jgi:NAD(P)-dependent dehydrogenase (short-subunit alcohol dehydrogenase family)
MSASDRSEQVVVITGGSSGIGLATALLLSAEGASVVLASRGEQALARAAQQCRDAGGTVLTVPTDVADPDAAEALLDSAVERFGHVDAVVQGAGVLAYGRFEDVPHEVFRRVVETNVIGTANVARASLRVFTAQQHGNLVVLGSVVGKIATEKMSNYQTSKWAVHGLARALQLEARHTPGVDVSLVTLGGVDTPIYTQAGNYGGRQGRPPPPVYSPERVARHVVHVVDHPQRDRSVGFANRLMVLGYRVLPSLYDVLAGPLMDSLAISKVEVPPGSGNVEEPHEDAEELHGRWKRESLPGLAWRVVTSSWRP